MANVHTRYIPRDPSEIQNIASSIQVIRTSDNASFLASKITDVITKDPGKDTTTTKLASAIIPTAGKSLSLILNHPNIISLVDIVRTSQVPGSTSEAGQFGDITVWEDMNAGSLAYLLPNPKSYPIFSDQEGWHTLAAQNFLRFSLPESLCWHVLKSICRALLWLHHGIKEADGIPGEWRPHDEDWHAILIMDVSPGQIWFKKPTEEETYGECKLGGFQWARVCGSLNAVVAMAPRVEDAPVVKQYWWPPEVFKNTHSPSRASEVWSLGAIVYTMMTGMPPPRYYEYDWQISRLNDKNFSQTLREIVADMLKPHPNDRPKSIDLVNRVEDAWAGWRATTKEGSEVVDVLDKVVERYAFRKGGLAG